MKRKWRSRSFVEYNSCDREEEEVLYNDQPESDQHFNLPRIQVILMILSMLAIIMDKMEMKLV